MLLRRDTKRSARLALTAAAGLAATACGAPDAAAQIDQQFLDVASDTTLTGVGNVVQGPDLTHDPAAGRPASADMVGTTISEGGVLEVAPGATAQLAGVEMTGSPTLPPFIGPSGVVFPPDRSAHLRVFGTADTGFTFTDATDGSAATLLADTRIGLHSQLTVQGGTFETHTLLHSGRSRSRNGGSLIADALRNDGQFFVYGGEARFRTVENRPAAATTDEQAILSIYDNGVLTADTITSSARFVIFDDGEVTAGAVENSDHLGIYEDGSLDAGTLRVTADGAVFVGAHSSTFAGYLTDHAGGGTLRIRETLHLNGSLQVGAGGFLLLDSGTVLTGSGSIDTPESWLLGTVAPGNSPGTMTFGSVATDANTRLEIELAPTTNPQPGVNHDQIVVTGTATIDGGRVIAQRFGAGDYTLGTEYEFLTADDLVVNQAFGVVSDIAGVGFTSAFTAGANGTYRLIVSRVATPLSVAGTFNQRTVGAALTALGSGPLLVAFNAAGSDAARLELLSDLSGEIFPTLLTAQAQDAARFFDLVSAQTFGPPWSCGNCGTPGADGPTGWLAGYGAGGRVNGDGNARTAETGVGGTAVGLSRCFGAVSGGGFYGYDDATVRVPGADSSVTTETHRVGGWGRVDAGRVHARAVGQVGFGESDSRRTFPGGASGAVFGEFNSIVSAGDLETGLRLGGATGYLVPALGLRYVHVDQDGFAETGGGAALNVADSTLSALRARLGVRAGAALAGGVPVTGTLSAFYSRDLNASAIGDIDAAFAAGGPAFTVRGTDFARDRVDLGPGVAIGDGPVKLGTDYRAGLTESSVEHAGQARLEVCF